MTPNNITATFNLQATSFVTGISSADLAAAEDWNKGSLVVQDPDPRFLDPDYDQVKDGHQPATILYLHENRSTVLPEASSDEKKTLLIINTQAPIQLAQFYTPEPQLR